MFLQVQNADDNIYPESVEPTLTFILQESGIIVLNNEQGFSAQNIRALCDVGNSTKKGSGSGYIGQKGIGFKSVFRVCSSPSPGTGSKLSQFEKECITSWDTNNGMWEQTNEVFI